MLIPFLLSIIAGLSTFIGALFVLFSKYNNKKLITFSLGFSAGVMLTISFMDLYPSAQEILIKEKGSILGIILSSLFLFLGILLAYFIDIFMPEKNIYSSEQSNLYRIGLVSMIALFLHNVPEGIATFISSYHNINLGISIALAIAIHNIPEGIAIAMPIYYSTHKKSSAFKYTFIASLAEPFGALLAFLFLKPYINDITLSIIFLIVAGIMIYISFQELLPEARKNGYKKLYILSIFLGIIIIPAHNILI